MGTYPEDFIKFYLSPNYTFTYTQHEKSCIAETLYLNPQNSENLLVWKRKHFVHLGSSVTSSGTLVMTGEPS